MITTLLERRSNVVDPVHPRDPALRNLWNWGEPTTAKIDVNEETALRFATVYACVRIISETISSLPIHVFESQSDGRRAPVSQHPLNWLLNVEANDDMTGVMFRETHTSHVLLSGNGFGRIVRNNRSEPAALEVRQWNSVQVDRNESGRLRYTSSLTDGGMETVNRDDMLHVAGLSSDGIVGKSPIRLMSESVATGMAAEKFAAAFFGNAARPSLAITMPPNMKLGDKAYQETVKRWEENHTGDNAWRPAVLDMGADIKPITMPLKDVEIVAILKLSVAQIARIYRIPLHMLAELDRATFSNIEQQSLDFEKHCIRPWLVRIEAEYNRKLFSSRNMGRLYVRHAVEGLLRADIKARFEAYKIAFMHGWMTINEIRGLEDRNPIEGDEENGNGGDMHFVPMNLQTLERATKEPEPVPDPLAEDDLDDEEDDETDEEEEDDEEEDEEGDDDESNSNSSSQASRFLEHLLSETVTSLVQREAHRAREYAKNPKTFIQKIDAFYESQSATMLERLGERHAAVVSRHVDESKRMLLEAAECSASQLVESVERTVDAWPARASVVSTQIMEGINGR